MSIPTKANVPHLQIPLTYLGGKPVVNEQDSWDDVLACVHAVCRYSKGQRADLPEFGITPLEFNSPGPNLGRLEQEILEWEPRAQLFTDFNIDLLNELAQTVAVRVGDPNA